MSCGNPLRSNVRQIMSSWFACSLGFGVLLICGCGGSSGPERASLSGQVTFDGVPVEKGTIAFIPDGKTVGPTAGGVIEKGRYSVSRESGPVLGTHLVEITAYRPGKQIEVAGAGGASGGPSGGGSVQETEMYIPEQYNKKTTLTVTIKSGSNVHDFPLKSMPSAK